MRVVLGLALMLSVLAPGSAQACTCDGSARTRVRLLPMSTESLPTNTRLRLALERDAELATASLRRTGGGARVVTTQRWVGPAGARYLEMIPLTELAPNTGYEVAITHSRGGQPELVGSFQTAAGPDRVAPTGGAITAARYFKIECNACCSSSPFAELKVDASSDPGGTSSALVLALWTARDGDALALRRPPEGYLFTNLLSPGVVTLGQGPMSCGPANFSFPAKTRQLRVGLRVLDLGGNYGPLTEVTLDLSRPESRL